MGGGGDFNGYNDYPQQQQQTVYPQSHGGPETLNTLVPDKKDQWAHDAINWVGDHFGYTTIIILCLLGCLFLFKKKIKEWIRSD